MSEVIKAVFQADSTDFQAEASRTIATLEKMEQRFAKPKKTALPILELTPASLQQLEMAGAKTKELARQTQLAGRGGMAGSMGFLAFSQAVEDAQYGVRGILNNIPQMVLGFGGGMGLAGAISLAAVAATTLYPHLKKLYGVTDNEDIEKAAGEWAKLFADGMKAAAAIRETAAAEQLAADLATEYNQALTTRLGLVNAMASAYDESLAAQRAQRDLDKEIFDSRESIVSQNGGDTTSLVLDRQSRDYGTIDADLLNRTKEFARAQEELMGIVTKRQNISQEALEYEKTATADIIRLTENLAGSNANIGQNQELLKTAKGQEGIEATKNIAVSTVRRDYIAAELARIQAEKKAYLEAATAAVADADAAIKAGDAKLNKTNQEIAALQALREQRQALNILERQALKLSADRKELEILKKQQPDLKQDRDTALDQQDNLSAQLEELQLLKEAAGIGKKKLETVREELALRKEAAQLAADTGISQEDARGLLKQRADAIKALEDSPTGTIKERRQARSEKRQEARDQARDERVAEAARKREERKRKNNKEEDPGIKDQVDIERLRKEAEEKRAKAQQELNENIQKQTTIQERIDKTLQNITSA